MRTVLLAVDGTQRGLETVSILGKLLRNQTDVKIVLFHCVQQIATLLPEDICMDVAESLKLTSETQERVGQAVLKASLAKLTEAGFPEGNVELRVKFDSVDPGLDVIEQAEIAQIRTIVVGRRGRSRIETLLLGSVAAKVAQYSRDKAVWIVDAPVNDSMKVMVAMDGDPEGRELSSYASHFFGPSPGLNYTFMHIVPPIPPTFWDDGHILGTAEQKDRQSRIEKWNADWTETVSRYMSEGRNLLVERGVGEQNVENLILQCREGIDRDLLNEIDVHKFQVVVMGKKSSRERKPFLLGSHTSKVLQNTRGVILCLVS